MTPPLVGSGFSPNNNVCDRNQVTSTLDVLPQDLQNPMSPMQSTQQVQPTQSAVQQQQSQSQINEMPNMVETIGVPLQQQNIIENIDTYHRQPGNHRSHFKTIHKIFQTQH